jgi:hypothetical protein
MGVLASNKMLGLGRFSKHMEIYGSQTKGEERMKIVINSDFGGFGLSDEAIREYGKRKGLNLIEEAPDRFGFVHFFIGEKSDDTLLWDSDIDRDDPVLVEIVEALTPQKAGSRFACLKVIEIPDGVEWELNDYDGMEHIAEVHRTWR